MIALLGGTFDPVHNAHLAMAQAALAHLDADEIRFMPTGTTKYRNPALASAKDRFAMLELALAGQARYRIDARELAPGASGYTVDTLRSLRAEIGDIPLCFLMGTDQYAKLGSWHRPEEVRRLAQIAVFLRPGFPPPDPNVRVIPMEPMPVSASDIRARAKRGEDLSALVPPAVANYVRMHRLYS
jgi:nicotinate-nucleotide adenylyltransferase